MQSHFVLILIDFFFKNQNTVVGKPIVKNNYDKPSVELKLLGLPHMVRVGSEPASLSFSSLNVLSFTRLISTEVFPTRVPLRLWEIDERWRWFQMWILTSQVKTKIQLEKFSHDLNEKLNTFTNILDDRVLKFNPSNNQEKGYLASESFQLKLSSAVTNDIFQQ